MRRTTWLWLAVAAVVVVVLAWGISGERPFVSWAINLGWVALLGAVVVRSVLRGRRESRSVSRVRRPEPNLAMQGLDEVQGIYLGRPPATPVTYGSAEGVVAEQVVPRRDELDLAHPVQLDPRRDR